MAAGRDPRFCELEKIATHYGIIRNGKMLREMTAAELERDCRTYTALQARNRQKAWELLSAHYSRVEEKDGFLRVYDEIPTEEIVSYLYENGVLVEEVHTDKIGLEEYYMDLMKEGKRG